MDHLLASARQDAIVDEVARLGGTRVSDLVARFGVSAMTARRDIAELASRGLVVKVHGGAVAVGQVRRQPQTDGDSARRAHAEQAIAASAANLVQAGDTVVIGAGDATFALARAISHVANLTVITNSIPVSMMLTDRARPDLTTILTGGEQTPQRALVGPLAVSTLQQMHANIAFISVAGIDATVGLTTPNLLEADTSRALIAAADRVVLLADSSKWGRVALRAVASLEEIDIWFSDDGLPEAAQAEARTRVHELVLTGLSAANQ